MRNIAILGVRIEEATERLLVGEVADYLRDDHLRTVAKVNAEFLVRSLNDPDFRTCLNSTDLNIADGTGVLWAARFLTLKTTSIPVLRQLQIMWQALYSLSSLLLHPEYCRYPIPERIPGVEALYLMLEAAQEADASVYFLGAGETVNAKARERIQAQIPGAPDSRWTGRVLERRSRSPGSRSTSRERSCWWWRSARPSRNSGSAIIAPV